MATANLNLTLPTVGGSRNSWGGIVNTGLSAIDAFAGASAPVGLIQMWPSSTAPDSTYWLLCDGASVSQTTYSELYALISALQPQLDPQNNAGSGNFRLPDMRGRFPLGYVTSTTPNGRSAFANSSNSLGDDAGAETGILTQNQIPGHTHTATTTVTLATTDPRDSTSDQANEDADGVVSTEETPIAISETAHSHTYLLGDLSVGSGSPYYAERNVASTITRTTASATTGITATTPAHGHDIPDMTHNHLATAATTNAETGGGNSHALMPPHFVVNFVILAKIPQAT